MNHRTRIGSRIKELRELKGISQKRLAELTGLNVPNISRIENGKYSTGLDILANIADALECEIDFNQQN